MQQPDEFEIFDHPILSEQDFADLKIKEGEYQFTVINAKPMIASTSGNKMIMLKCKVFDDKGKEHIMTDFLVSSEGSAYKIKHFWESVGYPERYNYPNKVSDYTNRSGYLVVKPQKDKRSGETENKIKDYITKKEDIVVKKEEPFIDDDIQF